MIRRILASRRAAAARSRPTAIVNARRACSSIEVPQTVARRRFDHCGVDVADHNLSHRGLLQHIVIDAINPLELSFFSPRSVRCFSFKFDR